MVRTRGGRRTSKSPSPRRRKNKSKSLSEIAARADALSAKIDAATTKAPAAGPRQYVWTGLDNPAGMPALLTWWPVVVRAYVVAVIAYCWLHYGGPPFVRAVGVVGACGFFAIETLWLSFTATDPATGHVVFRRAKGGGGGGWKTSTLAQWWCNALLLPHTLLGTHQVATARLCVPVVRALLPAAWAAPALAWLQPAAAVALFPVAVWSLEIAQGYLLIFLFRRNVAWWYHGDDAYFRGTIKLGHGWAWLALGLAVELAWAPLLVPAARAVGDAWALWMLAAAAVTWRCPRLRFND